MKKQYTALALGALMMMNTGVAHALSAETELLLELLKTKGIISQGEAKEFKETIEKTVAAAPKEAEKGGGAGSIASWADRIELSGVVEVAATSTDMDAENGDDIEESDIVLATAELDVAATINDYFSAHIAFLYEEGEEDDHVTVDSGYIAYDGGETYPVYGQAGKFVVPFGRYESHFLSDPLPLVLGETSDSAALIGYANDMFDVNFGIYRGDMREFDDDNHINSFVASATYTMPENSMPDLAFSAGISYTNNIAASGTLADLDGPEVDPDGQISDLVDGGSVFVSIAYLEKFFLEAEYLSALDEFENGDLTFVDNDNDRPRAWNIEAAMNVCSNVDVALRYGGSEDTGTELPEDEYGAVLSYGLRENTTLALEYILQDYIDNLEARLATLQLSVEF